MIVFVETYFTELEPFDYTSREKVKPDKVTHVYQIAKGKVELRIMKSKWMEIGNQ